MKKPFRPRRDFDGLEERRKRAGKLFAGGELKQAEIARRLGVTRTSVHRWHAAWLRGGSSALRGADRAGRKPRLKKSDLGRLDRTLREGAMAWGFSTDLWTLPRVARVIKETTGVKYHPGHVWRILRSLNWSRQRPARRAKERNEKEIQRWVYEDWPRVKKTLGGSGPGSSSKTRAASPTVPRSGRPGRRKAGPRL
jgi:transposase